MEGVAIVEGRACSLDEARIPLVDRGFLFGHCIFETLLIHKSKLWFWREHYARLDHGCRRVFIKPPHEAELFTLCELASREARLRYGESRDFRLRLMVSGGSDSALPIAPNRQRPSVYILCMPLARSFQETNHSSVRLKSVEDVRPKTLLDVKSSSYLVNMLALYEANEAGFDDALFVAEGRFTESTTANFVWFNSKLEVCSAPDAGNALPGITKLMLAKALEDLGEKLREQALGTRDLSLAVGAAITSTSRGVVQVTQIDNHSFDSTQVATKVAQLNKALSLRSS